MRHTRLILSLIAGSLLAAVVYFLPSNSVRKLNDARGHTLLALTDSFLLTVERWNSLDEKGRSICCCWDIQAGKLHRSIALPRFVSQQIPKEAIGLIDQGLMATSPQVDQNKVFLGFMDRRAVDLFDFIGYVCDIRSGQTTLPILRSDLADWSITPCLSPDGKYLAFLSQHPDSSRRVKPPVIMVFHTQIGEKQSRKAASYQVPNFITTMCFSRDSSKLAILSMIHRKPAILTIIDVIRQETIESHSLPMVGSNRAEIITWDGPILTCRVRNPKHLMGTTPWNKWDDQFIEIQLPSQEGGPIAFREIRPPSQLPGGFVQSAGHTWIEEISVLPELSKTSIQLYDRDTQVRKGTTIPAGVNHLISPFGNWIANTEENGNITLWNTNPVPRRIWSPLLTGLLAALLFWKCPLRFRRKQSPPSLTASI